MVGAPLNATLGLASCGNITAYHAEVTAHLGLVFDIALKYQDSGPVEELVGEGEIALCESVLRYSKDNPGCRFSTYAHRRIKRAIVSHLRTQGLVTSTEWQARVQQRARFLFKELAATLGRKPTEHEFIESAGEVMNSVYQRGNGVLISIDDIDIPFDDDDEQRLRERKDAMQAERYLHLPYATRAAIEALSSGLTCGEFARMANTPRNEVLADLAFAAEVMNVSMV